LKCEKKRRVYPFIKILNLISENLMNDTYRKKTKKLTYHKKSMY